MPNQATPVLVLQPEAVGAISRLLGRLDWSDVDAAPTARLMQEFLERPDVIEHLGLPLLVLTPDEVANVAQYVDFSRVRTKMTDFLERPDVAKELEDW
jgi:hypothetical protein